MRDSMTNTSRRIVIPLAAAFVATAMGAGTVMAQDEPAYAGLDKDLSGTTIKMATIGGQPYEAMYDSISKFEEETGATVEIVFLGDGFEIDRYLKTNYGAGTVDFDVAWNHTSFMSQYTNFVEPLQDYFTPEELAPFSPSIIEAATIDGNLQLIPRHADISALHYRTDLFGDADLQAKFEEAYGYPLAPPTTLDQMYDMSEFFVGEGVVKYGTQFAGKEEALAGRFYELLFANGGDYFDADLNPIFDSEAGVACGEMDAGPVCQWADPVRHAQPPLARGRGQLVQRRCRLLPRVVRLVLLLPGSRVLPQRGRQVRPGTRTGGARATTHTGWAGAHAFSVTKDSQNKEAAVQLVKFLTSEAVEYDEAKLGVLPVRSDVSARVQADAAASDVPLDSERLALAATQVSEDFRTPPLFADWISFTNEWFPTLQSIILGDMTVEDGLAKGVADTVEMLDSLGY